MQTEFPYHFLFFLNTFSKFTQSFCPYPVRMHYMAFHIGLTWERECEVWLITSLNLQEKECDYSRLHKCNLIVCCINFSAFCIFNVTDFSLLYHKWTGCSIKFRSHFWIFVSGLNPNRSMFFPYQTKKSLNMEQVPSTTCYIFQKIGLSAEIFRLRDERAFILKSLYAEKPICKWLCSTPWRIINNRGGRRGKHFDQRLFG